MISCNSYVDLGTQILQRARKAFASGKTRDVAFRVQQLQNLLRMYTEHEADLVTALYKDLRKPIPEAKLMEIEVLKGDVQTMIDNCKEWSKPQRVSNEREVSLLSKIPVNDLPFLLSNMFYCL